MDFLFWAVLFYNAFIICETQKCSKTMINGHGVTEGDKNIILEIHNGLRQALALGLIPGLPIAANMLEMNWDPDLARQAQKWANSCQNDYHDPRLGMLFVGQNIASEWTTNNPRNALDMMADFRSSIHKWFQESRSFRYGPFQSATGHFTQMIWAETNLIGCGFSFYFDPSKGYTKKYVCNYGPSGNVLEEYPYIKGRPACERFNLLISKQFQGLCVRPRRREDTNYIYG